MEEAFSPLQHVIHLLTGTLSRWGSAFLWMSLGVLAGVALWILLVRKDRYSPIDASRLIRLVILIGFFCRVVFALMTPMFLAPDEQLHWAYISHLWHERSFPIKGQGEALDGEFTQPPSYYLLAAGVHGILRTVIHGTDVLLLRLFSILLWLVTAGALLKLLDHLGYRKEPIGILTFSLFCLLPSYTFLSAMVNSDSLLIALGGVAYGVMAAPKRRGQSVLLGIVIGLALLTKMHAVVYLVAAVGFSLIEALRRRESFYSSLFQAIVIVAVALLLLSPWMIRNLRVYGELTGVMHDQPLKEWNSSARALQETATRISQTFWSASGLKNNVRFLPILGMHVTFLSLAGLVYGVLKRRKSLETLLQGPSMSFVGASVLAILLNLALAVAFSLFYGQPQGRYLFPSLIPISFLTALGLKVWQDVTGWKRLEVHWVGFLSAYCISFTVYSLVIL